MLWEKYSVMLHCLRSARGVPGAIFAGYVPLASLNPYLQQFIVWPIIERVINFWANVIFGNPNLFIFYHFWKRESAHF